MLGLKFVRPYASITDLPDAELPDFALLTGENGVGKTHLLQAIANGAVSVAIDGEIIKPDGQNVRFYDWSTLLPSDNGSYSSQNVTDEQANIAQQFRAIRRNDQYLQPARSALENSKITGQWRDPVFLLAQPMSLLTQEVGSEEEASRIRTAVREALLAFDEVALSRVGVEPRSWFRTVARLLEKPVLALTEEDIFSSNLPHWGQADLFQQSFARLFVAYRDALLKNELAEYQASKGLDRRFLSPHEFTAQNGTPPWDFVNLTLQASGLDFEINAPNQLDYTSFTPVMTKISTGTVVPFQSLSSGEKVIMSFAFAVYYSSDKRQTSMLPKLLLLDEVDAPLHPSMCRNILKTMTDVLVANGISIIATTHSPSTVALAPSSSIYTLRKGEPGLHSTSKSEALNILTVGVPTLSISFDGRRQVFVESPIDAQIYDSLYKLLKPRLKFDRSLEFIATGRRVAGKGDENNGCDAVKRLVGELTSAGNVSVFGLLDWDGHHSATDRIEVMGAGTRNGIESLILDPRILVATIVRDRPARKSMFGIPEDLRYLELREAPDASMQLWMDELSEKVLGVELSNLREIEYEDGKRFFVPIEYITMDDHELEEKVLRALPFLKEFSKGRAGALMSHIVGTVISDNEGLLPVEMRETLSRLLERPAH